MFKVWFETRTGEELSWGELNMVSPEGEEEPWGESNMVSPEGEEEP